jgi:hypothetical protein
MHANCLTARCGLVAAALGVLIWSATTGWGAPEAEHNAWPVVVQQQVPSTTASEWTGAGPFLFGKPAEDGGRVSGFRPFWVQRTNAAGQFREGYFVYPLFTYRSDENTYQWNFFELIRRTDRHAGAAAPKSVFEAGGGEFEIWPFWFSRQTGDPKMSYRALFPVAGTLRNKLGFNRASWVLFPLWVQTEKRGAVTTSVPWPFIRITRGSAHGFGIWPLFQWRERPGAWRQEFYLWPLGYNNTTQPPPEAPAGTPPIREIGVLPLYARRTAQGYIDESYLWPFFGYTDRTVPSRYHETRYLWPFLVQGRGDAKYINRWGPLYTHSVVNGYDKTWYAWPVMRHAEWADRGLAMTKTQVLYFLYWSETQRSIARPHAPMASLRHVWPLYSSWDNGAGRQQFQLFSPFEVFFPGNEKVRATWSPLVAIARREQTAPGESRVSLLWNLVTWRHDAAHGEREFHLGPLFSTAEHAEERRIAIGNGLIAFRRQPDAHWHVSWFDFSSPSSTTPANPPH